MLEEPNHLTVGQTPALLVLHRVVAHRTAFGVVVAVFVGPVIEDVVVVPVVDVVPHGLIASRATLCCFVPERSCRHDSSPLPRSGVRSPTGPSEQDNRWSTAFCAALAARHSTLESAFNWRAQLAR